ncbi:MAG: Sua5/YciO/YrdC/YwlC family protein [Gammaproteobacteria bacterium AqS3]|nr:Sua5/YciO/YrdC/YwlC family protein [Gammaproteobacteria bacterium AqS3]
MSAAPGGASEEATRLDAAAGVLSAGGIVALPTEGVWGLSCDPASEAAVRRLLALKQRGVEKGLILVGHEPDCFAAQLGALEPAARADVLKSWPGPHTWLLPGAGAPGWIRGDSEWVAARVSEHPLLAGLCRRWGGALVSTSANLAGSAPAADAAAVRETFGDAVGCILDGALGGLGGPSAIRNAATGEWVRRP